MLAGPDLAPLRLVLLVAIAVAAVVVSRWISRRAGWGPAGPLALIAATPLVPSLPIGYGLSTDDVLPAIGVVLGLMVVDWRSAGRAGWPRLLLVGAALMAAAGLIASVANADGAQQAVVMALKSTGQLVFLALIGVAVVLSLPAERRHLFVAWAVAAVATAEALFGLVAWLVPLPWAVGLEASRQMTSLLGRVPGRLAGTTGLSPNFLGALFVLSLPLTAALALRATDRRQRLALWAALGVQLVALALTFTRTSLVIGIAILVVLLLMRGHGRVLLVLGALVLVVALATPLGARMLGDANDRAALWSGATRMMIDHPLTGVGPGRMLIEAAENPDRYRHTDFGEATNNAHNTILLAGAETGVMGAIGSLLVNVSVAASAIAALLAGARRRRLMAHPQGFGTSDLVAAAALGVLGFLVQGMTNNLFAVRVTSVGAMLVYAAFLVPPGIRLAAALRAAMAGRTEGTTAR